MLWQALREDFSDLPDAASTARLVTRLVLAGLLGAALGFERERSGKDAGLRTHMLVCLGAALFVYIPQQAGMEIGDLSRVVQGILTGVGFLGGGAILKHGAEHRIEGLTTAAGIWLTAAIGVAAGLGRSLSAVVGTALALVVLAGLARASRLLQREAEPPEARAEPPGGGAG